MQRITSKELGHILVTGGTGFIGSYLAKRLVDLGATVRILDNNIRGGVQKLGDYLNKVEYIEGDVTNFDQVMDACKGIDTIFHLAFINGTENFYKIPGRVLEVGVKGAINTMDAAMSCGIKNYIAMSSSEVYQEPTHVPTTEEERIIIPDIKNPRFSYSGGKIITELLALHYTVQSNLKTVICRPHNFYGPDMGMGHVIPQFIVAMKTLSKDFTIREIEFPILGTGDETRSFCYIDDAVEGIILCAIKGENREIYHIGTEDEISIAELANHISRLLGLKIRMIKKEALAGGTKRRCPSIKKIGTLGYKPGTPLVEGLRKTIEWYTKEDNLLFPTLGGELVR